MCGAAWNAFSVQLLEVASSNNAEKWFSFFSPPVFPLFDFTSIRSVSLFC